MPAVLVRDLSQSTLDALKRRAARHGRSLQQELRLILEAAAAGSGIEPTDALAARIRERLAGSGRRFSDSTELQREDRQR